MGIGAKEVSNQTTRPIMVKQIVVWICQPCLDGEGSECHTPGCALWMHRVDLPIPPELYTEIGAMEAIE